MILGTKVFLRALEPEDIEMLYLWENSVDYWPFNNQFSMLSKALLKNYIETVKQDVFTAGQYRYAIVEKDKNLLIGCIDLYTVDPIHSKAAVGVLIGNKTYRKKGLATDALRTLCKHTHTVLQLHQLYCEIFTDNEASIRLFQNCSFIKTGEKKDWHKISGCYKTVGFFQCILDKTNKIEQ